MRPRRGAGAAALALLLGGVAVGLPGAGCEEPLICDLRSLCCESFVASDDLTQTDWSFDDDVGVDFGFVAQGAIDVAATTSAALLSLGDACGALARALGGAPIVGRDEALSTRARTSALCAEAARALSAARASGTSVRVTSRPCAIHVAPQVACEKLCVADPLCEPEVEDVAARCPGGALRSVCGGDCAGSCEGAGAARAFCQGRCDGTCDGSCDGTCDPAEGDACRGSCDGTCNGACDGPCELDAAAPGVCGGYCVGTCSVPAHGHVCLAELTPLAGACAEPGAACLEGCRASAVARAECPAPAVVVEGVPAAEPALAAILSASGGRGQALAAHAAALREILPPASEDLPGLCTPTADETLANAVANATALAEGSDAVARAALE